MLFFSFFLFCLSLGKGIWVEIWFSCLLVKLETLHYSYTAHNNDSLFYSLALSFLWLSVASFPTREGETFFFFVKNADWVIYTLWKALHPIWVSHTVRTQDRNFKKTLTFTRRKQVKYNMRSRFNCQRVKNLAAVLSELAVICHSVDWFLDFNC